MCGYLREMFIVRVHPLRMARLEIEEPAHVVAFNSSVMEGMSVTGGH